MPVKDWSAIDNELTSLQADSRVERLGFRNPTRTLTLMLEAGSPLDPTILTISNDELDAAQDLEPRGSRMR